MDARNLKKLGWGLSIAGVLLNLGSTWVDDRQRQEENKAEIDRQTDDKMDKLIEKLDDRYQKKV